MSLEDFKQDKKTVRAVAYEIGILGEAANAIPEEVRKRYPEIPWDKMRGMRNVIVHEYFHLDPGILWRTVNKRLSPLAPHLKAMLQGEM